MLFPRLSLHSGSAIDVRMYEIKYASEAVKDLKSLRKVEQEEVLDGVDTQLKHEPAVETRNRKKLRPNDIAEWELRLGKFRVFYNVLEEIQVVRIEAVGIKKVNLLFIRGEERNL